MRRSASPDTGQRGGWQASPQAGLPAVTPNALAGNPARAIRFSCFLMTPRVLIALRSRAAFLAAGIALAGGVFAQPATSPNLLLTPSLPTVVVTANRIPEDPTLLPMGVTVISAADIRSAGITDVNEALRWLGGVVTRIDSSFTRNPTLDLRGFGETAGSNVVILVDGVRQNEGDMSGAAISWIPVDSIERIEIVRGSGAVAHGEGATGGVINIVTSKGLAEPGGSVAFGVGSRQTREARASVRTGTGNWRHQLYGTVYDTDNHRDNYRARDRSVLARSTWSEGDSLFSAQLGLQDQRGGLPGGLTVDDFNSNPRQTLKPEDRGSNQTRNLLLSGEGTLAGWRLGFDLNHRESNADATYVADGYLSGADTAANRGGLKAWRSFDALGASHRLLVGTDIERWTQDKLLDWGVWGTSRIRVQQRSDAAYLRHEVEWRPQGIKVHAGVRRTVSEREASGDSLGSLAVNNTSWELGAAMRLALGPEVYGRMGTSFRLANSDEFSCSGFTCPPNTLNMLRPQTSRDQELGLRQRTAQGQWALRVYRSSLVNEIGLSIIVPSAFPYNTNYDPTLRQGVELEASGRLLPKLEAGVVAAARQSEFRQGDYAGKRIPMVANQSLTSRFTYQPFAGQQWVLLTQWVSDQRIGGDLDNSCSQTIPAYAVTNLRVSQKVADWTLSTQVTNLLDRHYYDYRTRCDPTKQSVYPQAGRSFMLSASRNF